MSDNKKSKDIMIVGVGGQGSLLASQIIGNAVLMQGYDVKVSEVHGMSQRGGSVVTYVKYGEKVYSPVINNGEADIILSFELLEAARWLPCLRKGGQIITSLQRINPMPVVTGNAEYPDAIEEKIRAKGVNITTCDALSLAREAGSEKAVNVVLIGVLAANIGFDIDIMREAVKKSVPEKLLAINLKAFELGVNYKK